MTAFINISLVAAPIGIGLVALLDQIGYLSLW